jgi:hypothetical protein
MLIVIAFANCTSSKRITYNVINETEKFKNMENKRFDIDSFTKNSERGASYRFTLEDSTEILQMKGLQSGYVEWQSPSDKFYKIYKTFHSNLNLKSKEYRFFGIKIGISEHYDEQGNKTLVNEDEKFGKFDYNHLILFLERKGYVNSETTKGKDDLDIDFIPSPKVWIIETKKDMKRIKINGNTGSVIKIEDLIMLE